MYGGGLQGSIDFIVRNPEVQTLLLAHFVTYTTGAMCIFELVSRYGALTATTVTTLRKLISIMASVIMYLPRSLSLSLCVCLSVCVSLCESLSSCLSLSLSASLSLSLSLSLAHFSLQLCVCMRVQERWWASDRMCVEMHSRTPSLSLSLSLSLTEACTALYGCTAWPCNSPRTPSPPCASPCT
jgi:hypothetical protein